MRLFKDGKTQKGQTDVFPVHQRSFFSTARQHETGLGWTTMGSLEGLFLDWAFNSRERLAFIRSFRKIN